MYETLDSFLNVDTWSTLHFVDEERFFQALDKIVWRPDFSTGEMRKYISKKIALDSLPEDHRYQEVVERCVEMATVVRRYLEATGQF